MKLRRENVILDCKKIITAKYTNVRVINRENIDRPRELCGQIAQAGSVCGPRDGRGSKTNLKEFVVNETTVVIFLLKI